jgi:hypothetical protein
LFLRGTAETEQKRKALLFVAVVAEEARIVGERKENTEVGQDALTHAEGRRRSRLERKHNRDVLLIFPVLFPKKTVEVGQKPNKNGRSKKF